ncbi:hypothetical protein CASFOL_029654 [Castilleja foliolosa]|uniref:Secreted protein n=1 Tax=Castilleja foliolosa TaxID=1961234 RepID=A0ABD3C8G3_9LAMI
MDKTITLKQLLFSISIILMYSKTESRWPMPRGQLPLPRPIMPIPFPTDPSSPSCQNQFILGKSCMCIAILSEGRPTVPRRKRTTSP